MELASLFPTAVAELEEIKETHNRVESTPFGDDSLTFSLVLPKTWKFEEDLGEQSIGIARLVTLGVFGPQLGPESPVVQVSYSPIPFEINVLDWIKFQAEKTGVRLSYAELCEFSHGSGVDAGGFIGPENDQHVVRVTGFADNGRVFLAMGMVKEKSYESNKNDLAIATHTFRLVRPAGHGALEQRLNITMQEPDCNISYPASWEPAPVEQSVSQKIGLDFRLISEGTVLAYLRVKAMSEAEYPLGSLDSQLSDVVEELASAGVSPTESWRPEMVPLADVTNVFVAKGTMNGGMIEIRYGSVVRNGVAFALTLISVTREDSPILWMRSNRAFELGLATADV